MYENLTFEEMLEELLDFHKENGGYEDYFERQLKNKTREEIADMYKATFDEIYDK